MKFFLALLICNISFVSFAQVVPPFPAVCEQALHEAHLDWNGVREWERQVKKTALLPRLQMDLQRNVGNDINIDVGDSVSVSSSGVTVGPSQQQQTQKNNEDFNIEIKAVWFLDQLLYSKDRLEISQEARYLSEARQRVLNDVRKYYFQRENALKEIKLLRKSNANLSLVEIKELGVVEATAALDGMTGGWFSQQLKEEK